MKKIVLSALAALAASAAPALAADLPVKALRAPAPVSWWDTVKIYAHVEGGVTFNAHHPSDGINFGHLFTDKANTPLLNQAVFTIERPLDPKATGYDFGFKFQGMFGSDSRYTNFIGIFDTIDERHRPDIVEAHLLFHMPWLTQGGIDLKVGQYVTLEGAEVIYAPSNLLYTHSYIFNFGIPFKHTGALATIHVNPVLDLYAGVDTGVNTSLGRRGDNNSAAAFHGGIGLNLLGGALTVLASTHIGPETPNNNRDLRYLNDVTITWKVNDNLTLITDLNYARDDFAHADGYGVAQYVAYKINDMFKVVGRGEIWRDNAGFFVAAYPGNLDFLNFERGLPATVIGGGITTYGALTLGLNISPPVPKTFEGFVIRPEVRYDASLNGTTPFGAGTKSSQFTFGGDIIFPFTLK